MLLLLLLLPMLLLLSLCLQVDCINAVRLSDSWMKAFKLHPAAQQALITLICQLRMHAEVGTLEFHTISNKFKVSGEALPAVHACQGGFWAHQHPCHSLS
jgi:hypothetical protein